jgi:hypothetical protein
VLVPLVQFIPGAPVDSWTLHESGSPLDLDGLCGRGLVDAAGGFTDAGRETKERIEALTDELESLAYDVLSTDKLDELIAELKPIAAAAQAAHDLNEIWPVPFGSSLRASVNCLRAGRENAWMSFRPWVAAGSSSPLFSVPWPTFCHGRSPRGCKVPDAPAAAVGGLGRAGGWQDCVGCVPGHLRGGGGGRAIVWTVS